MCLKIKAYINCIKKKIFLINFKRADIFSNNFFYKINLKFKLYFIFYKKKFFLYFKREKRLSHSITIPQI